MFTLVDVIVEVGTDSDVAEMERLASWMYERRRPSRSRIVKIKKTSCSPSFQYEGTSITPSYHISQVLIYTSSATKFVVGTQLGVLSIFSRQKGWGDCVDRIPGHPHSVDALCALPSSYPSSTNTILTGSSDGLLRVVELFPTKLVGVVADHGEWPIERIKVDQDGEGRWVGSVGHEDVLRMTDLREVFEDEDGEEGDADAREEESEDEEAGERAGQFASPRRNVVAPSALDADSSDSDSESDEETTTAVAPVATISPEADSEEEAPVVAEEEPQADADSDSDEDVKERVKKRKKKDKLSGRVAKKGRNDVEVADKGFFSGL